HDEEVTPPLQYGRCQDEGIDTGNDHGPRNDVIDGPHHTKHAGCVKVPQAAYDGSIYHRDGHAQAPQSAREVDDPHDIEDDSGDQPADASGAQMMREGRWRARGPAPPLPRSGAWRGD